MTLFPDGQPLVTGRIALSSLTEEAVAHMPWLEAALAPEWTLDDFEAARPRCEGVLISDLEGTPMGLVLVGLDSPASGDATIVFLAMQPERRYRGLGGEAGLAVLEKVRTLSRTFGTEIVIDRERGVATVALG